MNIAFVSDAIYPYNKGGKEKRLYEMSTRLAASGHTVTIYCMKWWDGPEKSRIEEGVRLQAISKLYPMYNGDKRSIKEGVMFGLACWRLLSSKYHYDIIDVDHMPFFPIFSTWMVCLLKDFDNHKMFGTWHEALTRNDWLSYMGAAGNVAALIERTSIHLPHTITAASGQTYNLINSELKRRKRVQLVPSGIDVTVINKIQPADVVCDVLFVGRLVKDKNVAMLVESIALVAKRQPTVSCIIVGKGIERPNMDKLIAKHSLKANITVIENLPQATDVYAYMKAAKVFVLPSSREGFGIVVLEALACGTPVITINTAANAARLLIKEGKNGSVVEPSASSLANSIRYWLATAPDAKLRKAISSAVEPYDWRYIVARQLQVYQRSV